MYSAKDFITELVLPEGYSLSANDTQFLSSFDIAHKFVDVKENPVETTQKKQSSSEAAWSPSIGRDVDKSGVASIYDENVLVRYICQLPRHAT